MSSHGIADRVAIVAMGCIAMGCTPFGEHWSKSAEDLLIDAVTECLASVPGVSQDDVDAYWLGTLGSGQSGLTLSRALATGYKPVTRVENYCASGSESFRNACYAVASGAYDVVMATDPAYCARYGVDPADMRAAMTHVAWKNHVNGARNPKAQFRAEVPKEKIEAAPKVAGRLGVVDCSGVSDGAAAR